MALGGRTHRSQAITKKTQQQHSSVCRTSQCSAALSIMIRGKINTGTHSKLLERQNSNIIANYQELESAYTAALNQIHQYKLNEQQIKEEQAQRELEYMNQMNEVCRDHNLKEQDYMGQIIELQNRLNEIEIEKRRKSQKKEGKEVCDAVSDLETAIRIAELNDSDEENSDDCSIDYI
eukprot:scaffold7806_cov35-Cyclotella_meneghiniana.AAC.2